MKVTPASIAGVMIIEPRVFGDPRGFFYESFNQRAFRDATGIDVNFVQDNHSRSAQGVLRGLHYQIQQPQGKLVRVVRGAIKDVVVDMRRSSPTYGQWLAVDLDEESSRQVWIPPGFAHGFQVVSAFADVLYKTTDYYAPEFERCLAWNDASIGIEWPIDVPVLSDKDRNGHLLANAESYT